MKCEIFVISSAGEEKEKKLSEKITKFLEGKKVIMVKQSSATVDSDECHPRGETNKHIKVLATHITIFYEEK